MDFKIELHVNNKPMINLIKKTYSYTFTLLGTHEVVDLLQSLMFL